MEEVFLTDLDKRIAMFIEQKGGDSAVAKKTKKNLNYFKVSALVNVMQE